MSGRDQQDPIHKKDEPAIDSSGQVTHGDLAENHRPSSSAASSADSASSNPSTAASHAPWFSDDSPIEPNADSVHASPIPASPIHAAPIHASPIHASPMIDDLAEEPAFYLPAIPIEPTRPINTPASRALASGDDLLDFVRDPLGHGSSIPSRPIPGPRSPIPVVLAPEPFAKAPPSDPNQPFPGPPDAITRADRLTEALRPEAPAVEVDNTLDNFSLPAFPITPIKPFAAPPHAEAVQDLTAPLNSPESPGAPSIRRPSGEWVGDQQPDTRDPRPETLDPRPDTLDPRPETRHPTPDPRIPNLGHVIILLVFASLGFLAAGLAVQIAFRFHLWGVQTIDQATTEVHYTLASMAVLYFVSFAVAFFAFPFLWHKSLFAGLQWNASAARRNIGWLIGGAFFCFILALVDELILPGPDNAPIDKMFSNTTAAWLLFGFGVAVAPFFEEMTFRGFLLPALCTACDWVAEYIKSEHQGSRPALVFGSALVSSALAALAEQKFGHHRPSEWGLVFCFIILVFGLAGFWLYLRYQTLDASSRMRPLGPHGNPQWSLAAMIVGSALTSLPFAAMHADQIAHSIGPLVLLYCVSLILCFSRLATRSLAASTLVHASYNFMLFSMMLVGTGGFKHLDKM